MNKQDITNPFEQVLKKENNDGELLVARLRLAVILIFIPIIYLVRFYTGYLLSEYIFLAVGKWFLMSLTALMIFYILKRGFYHHFLGYITISLDLVFITASILTLSFYKTVHHGGMYEPLFILFYFVSFSTALRKDYRFSLFSVPATSSMIFFIAFFDLKYHNTHIDYIVLFDRIAVFVLTTAASIITIKKFTGYIATGYSLLDRHSREISSFLKIGQKISSRSELEKTLAKISKESIKLLQSDICFIALKKIDTSAIEILFKTGMESNFFTKDSTEILKTIERQITESSGVPLIYSLNHSPENHPDQIKKMLEEEKIKNLICLPICADSVIMGIIASARRQGNEFSSYETEMLQLLSEQAAISIKNASLLEKLRNENIYIQEKKRTLQPSEQFIGQSQKIQEVFRIIEKASKAEIPVLIRGESGTGKELVADALWKMGSRKDMPLLKINCAAIPENLLESELFGYEKGAFTGAQTMKKGKFELAHQGTLFLDEIGDMSPKLQIKLLRVLQENEFERLGSEVCIKVNVRIIAATNQNIENSIMKGCFREDLFYRINGLPIFIPPLRERKQDIPILVNYFTEKYNNDKKRQIKYTRSAINHFCSRQWKGNIRELENLIHRLMIMIESNTISESVITRIAPETGSKNNEDNFSLLNRYIDSVFTGESIFSDEIEKFEKILIHKALNHAGNNIRQAGKTLNLPKSTLFNKMKKYNIKIND